MPGIVLVNTNSRHGNYFIRDIKNEHRITSVNSSLQYKRIRMIFPAASDVTSAVKRNSDLNDSSGIVSHRKIEVRLKSTDSLVKTAA